MCCWEGWARAVEGVGTGAGAAGAPGWAVLGWAEAGAIVVAEAAAAPALWTR